LVKVELATEQKERIQTEIACERYYELNLTKDELSWDN